MNEQQKLYCESYADKTGYIHCEDCFYYGLCKYVPESGTWEYCDFYIHWTKLDT